tara:strand:+ start:152 stop:424 length:273 start_codon:yes stop_codon:yes gene_type:complete
VKEAVEVMSKTNIGAILVEEQKDPVGIFTERDYLMKIAAKELNPANVKISGKLFFSDYDFVGELLILFPLCSFAFVLVISSLFPLSLFSF